MSILGLWLVSCGCGLSGEEELLGCLRVSNVVCGRGSADLIAQIHVGRWREKLWVCILRRYIRIALLVGKSKSISRLISMASR